MENKTFNLLSAVSNTNENKIRTVGSLSNVKESSYLSQTFDYMMKSHKEYCNATENLYIALSESTTQEVINESFSDFFSEIKNIIDKFLEFIKSIFNRFITNMNSIIKSDTHIRKHKDDFRKFSTEHEFDYTGYEYTIDNPAIPVCNPIEHSEITGYKDGDPSINIAGLAFASGDTADQIVTKIKASYDALISTLDEEVWADEVRAKVIGRDDSISDTMFMEELFSVYRNDTTDKDTIRVTSSYVMDAYKRFEKYQEKKKAVEKKKTEIEKNYKTLKKEIENTINTNKLNGVDIGTYAYTSGEKPTSGIGELSEIQKNKIVDSINLYYKARVTQIERISDIHAMAFAAKLDAFKDCYSQDKTVLYKALYKVQGLPKA